jgi:hypothetical protein
LPETFSLGNSSLYSLANSCNCRIAIEWLAGPVLLSTPLILNTSIMQNDFEKRKASLDPVFFARAGLKIRKQKKGIDDPPNSNFWDKSG